MFMYKGSTNMAVDIFSYDSDLDLALWSKPMSRKFSFSSEVIK